VVVGLKAVGVRDAQRFRARQVYPPCGPALVHLGPKAKAHPRTYIQFTRLDEV